MPSLRRRKSQAALFGEWLFDLVLLLTIILLAALPPAYLFAREAMFGRVFLAFSTAVAALWALAVILPAPPEAGK